MKNKEADYLDRMKGLLSKKWPENRIINIVCHGHSVPSGYFKTPHVDTINAYPQIFLQELKDRYPFAVINVIVTAIGGENSDTGARRFETDVLMHKPDLVTIDYGLNDRWMSPDKMEANWQMMINKCKARNIPVILLTPTFDDSREADIKSWKLLEKTAELIRRIAKKEKIGFADSFKAFTDYEKKHGEYKSLLSQSNHPSRRGHEIVAAELIKHFM